MYHPNFNQVSVLKVGLLLIFNCWLERFILAVKLVIFSYTKGVCVVLLTSTELSTSTFSQVSENRWKSVQIQHRKAKVAWLAPRCIQVAYLHSIMQGRNSSPKIHTKPNKR